MTNEHDLKSEGRVELLKARREKVSEKLKEARSEFLSARARRNYLERRLDLIDDEIEALQQGQLCLGDRIRASE